MTQFRYNQSFGYAMQYIACGQKKEVNMNNWKLTYNHEESVASNNLISLYIEVEFEGQKMKDILDADSLFSMIESDGFIPLFTCRCGFFGCGGCYVKITHTPKGIVLNNTYKPVDNPTEKDLVNTFQSDLTWEDLYFIASDVYEYICGLVEKYPVYGICCGTYDANLVPRLHRYKELLEVLGGRYNG